MLIRSERRKLTCYKRERMTRAVAIVALIACPCVALAQPRTRSEAAGHFARGEAAQADGRFREAIDEYEQAYALVPHANALFNIAVCYERLSEWQRAVDYYQRYLDDGPANDAPEVIKKIRALQARIALDTPVVLGNAWVPPPTRQTEVHAVTVPEATPPELHWHGGVSYGVGFGDAPTERYLAHAGRTFAHRFDVDAIVGSFGKNDHAIGVMGRVVFARVQRFAPFARGAVTLGYAKQDASSAAGMRFPIGLEAGGGVEFGTRGRFELFAATRWIRGGWDATETTSDSYVNDSFAFTIDLGLSLDFGAIRAIANVR